MSKTFVNLSKYLAVFLCLYLIFFIYFFSSASSEKYIEVKADIVPEAQTPNSISPLTYTPKPFTFSELDNLYGPCIRLPVFMYHHVQPEKEARRKRQVALTTYTDIFLSQMK